MSLSISENLFSSSSCSEEILSSSQLLISASLRSFCEEARSFSAIFGLGVGQTLSCLVKAQSFRFLPTLFGSKTSRIPLYNVLSSGFGLVTEGTAFPVATTLGKTGEFQFATWQETVHGSFTIGACHVVGKHLKIGNFFIQHFVQDCAMVSVDYSFEKIGFIETKQEGLVSRLAGAELTSFRMGISAQLLAISCPDLTYIRVRQEINVEVYKSNQSEGSKQWLDPLKELFSPALAATNGEIINGLNSQRYHDPIKPILEAKDLIHKMEGEQPPPKKSRPLSPSKLLLRDYKKLEKEDLKTANYVLHVLRAWNSSVEEYYACPQEKRLLSFNEIANNCLSQFEEFNAAFKKPLVDKIIIISRKFVRIAERIIIRAADIERRQQPTLEDAVAIETVSVQSYRKGKIVFIKPYTQDHRKITKYKKHRRSVGLFYFRLRQERMMKEQKYISTVEMGKLIGKGPNYWHTRELRFEKVKPIDLSEMIQNARQCGKSAVKIRRQLVRMGIKINRLTYLLAEALCGASIVDVVQHSAITDNSLLDLFNGDHNTCTSPTILQIVEGIKKLNPPFHLPLHFGARVYRLAQPGFKRFSKEAFQGSPVLVLTPEQIKKAFNFDPRIELFRRRMDEEINKGDLGNTLGVSDVMVNKYERVVISEFSDETLLGIANFTKRELLETYLPYRPEILRLFNLKDPETGQIYRLKEKDYEALLKGRIARQDPTNLRSELKNWMSERGIESDEVLMSYMDGINHENRKKVDVGKLTQRLLRNRSEILYLEDILFLKLCFPELSVRKWYEHFYYARLVYFLGTKPDGTINYDFPQETPNWKKISPQTVIKQLDKAIETAREKGLHLTEPLLGPSRLSKFKSSLIQRKISEENLARATRVLNLDRRMFFFYVAKDELKTVLES